MNTRTDHDVYCAGGSVRLHCSVTNVESSSVSWIRLSDFQILANGLGTFTTDPRSEPELCKRLIGEVVQSRRRPLVESTY